MFISFSLLDLTVGDDYFAFDLLRFEVNYKERSLITFWYQSDEIQTVVHAGLFWLDTRQLYYRYNKDK